MRVHTIKRAFPRFGGLISAIRSERGGSAIEWAIFALLALSIGGLVAAAITAAINNRIPSIQ